MATSDLLQSVASALSAVEQSDGSFRCKCPAHSGESDTSLSLKAGDKHPVVVHCYADCDWRDIHAAITASTGIEIWARAQRVDRTTPSHTIAEYQHDTQPVKRVYRRYSASDGKKVWQSEGSTEGYHVLFWRNGRYTQEVPKAGTRVYMPEGEKAAAALSERLPVVAASFCGGTGSADKFNLARLKGLEVVYWADRDPAGQRCAVKVSKRLSEADIVHWALMEAGGDGADAADFSDGELYRRFMLVEGWAAVGQAGKKAKNGRYKVLPHPPLKPLTVHVGSNERREMFRHMLGQLGIRVRENGRSKRLEQSADRQRWEQIRRGWLEHKRPDALSECTTWHTRDQQWQQPAMSKPAANDELIALGHESTERGDNDDVRTWLESLPAWDGVPRCETFLCEHYGAADTPLNRWVSAALFVQPVARTLKPGILWRGVPVLVGPQLSGKSELFRQMMPEHLRQYVVSRLDLSQSPKEMAARIIGAAIVELSEMAGMNAKTMHTIKAFIAAAFDDERLAYRPDKEQIARTCAFIGTMNTGDTIPADHSGNTRWAIVEVPKSVQVEALMTDQLRNQLFAEALTLVEQERFQGGIDRDLLDAQQEQNQQHTDEEEDLATLVDKLWEQGANGMKLLDMAQEVGLVPKHDGPDAIVSFDQLPQGASLRRKFGDEMRRRYTKRGRAKLWYRKVEAGAPNSPNAPNLRENGEGVLLEETTRSRRQVGKTGATGALGAPDKPDVQVNGNETPEQTAISAVPICTDCRERPAFQREQGVYDALCSTCLMWNETEGLQP